MAGRKTSHARINVRLTDLQDQVRMADASAAAAEPHEQEQWELLCHLLGELYYQLQHQKQVVVYRSASRTGPKGSPAGGRK